MHLPQTLGKIFAIWRSKLDRRLAPISLSATNASGPEPNHDDVFSHGYLLTDEDSQKGDGWRHISIGPFHCYRDPRTQYTTRIEDLCGVLLIGHLVDIDKGESDLSRITRHIAKLSEIRGRNGAMGSFTYRYTADAQT